MVVTRNPLLCLDTNASIDIGVVTDIRRQGKSLDGQVKAIDIRNGVPHDKATMEYVTKLFGDRNKQLRGTAQFLNAVKGCSRLRLPEFAKIEHLRVRHDAQPPAPTVPITDAAHRISLEVFSRTKLSLQDSVILASAIDMRADALVSNDEDFKREFKSRTGFTAFGFTALQMLGKPLYLLDHRVPHSGGDAAPTLYAMVLRSLLSHYSNSKHPEAPKHPRFGHPLWVDRRRGTSEWYLAYRQPLVKGMKPYLVPGRDDLSIIDERSWTVCEIGSVHFFNESLPGRSKQQVHRLAARSAQQA